MSKICRYMKQSFLALLSLFLLLGSGCAPVAQEESSITFTYPDSVEQTTQNPTWTFPGTLPEAQIQNKQIRLSTSKGEIVFELFGDTAPQTVSNFVYLTQGGFYNGLTFHRREEGFVIQGGDPNGNGTGGPGYKFPDELNDSYTYERGIVAMANSGSNTNGSQFFIMLDDTPLPKAYSIFGRVVQGMDVVNAIAVGDVMTQVTVEDKQ
ncbi:TPA: peptidylprolyl isomerase [Candidatus Uhrbacteria bacterium]|nr:peptidylprolyl isomerase [Candidatus Uhrbacteria bacterium]HAU66301.1 peptidylprolyl isomerase [Candidatus Uhrbacteria bacterium]